ncbi:tyrosine-protein kinase domain-containing protein [Sphingomonas solaris]|uniref:non-specific protein-tyrosine kinase n=1 Tax=Alterirhizorhabdus solaris TaxID=2529389 RepID=A0A558QSM8_9SPHN|nr:tyrosine-protein kinase domain-containing protein [Sphingomonas solaris]TVV70150.1 AAA family ATPase [Sphingomonas solaris]
MDDARDLETPERTGEGTGRHPVARAPHEIAAEVPRGFSPRAILDAVRRRRRVFLIALAAVLAIGLALLAIQPARYTATAEVVLDTSDGVLAPRAATQRTTEERAGREIRLVRSREMAVAVATALKLDAGFLADDPRLLARIGRMFGSGPAPLDAAGQMRAIVDRLTGPLAVNRLEGTYSLTIGYTAGDPRTAARVANEYAVQYSSGRLAGATAAASPFDRPYARIISRAEPPLAPSSPRPLPVMALALLAGLLAGTAAALVVERRFSGITGGHEIEKLLGLPHLGNVPLLSTVLPAATSPLEAMVTEQMSAYAEAFRGVMMAVRQAGGRGTQAIAITSALPNEGKTTVAACLARSIALAGESVVLVDCDARRRDTSAIFGMAGRRPGLVEVLRYEATLDEALVRDTATGAWLLPLTGPMAEVSDLLSGPRMVELIEDLKRRFKRVLIDTAPILAISTTRALATMVDVVVMVVRWRATPDHAVVTALRMLPDDHVRIAGIVLAQVDMNRQVKFGHGDPAFYYKQYSQYYS